MTEERIRQLEERLAVLEQGPELDPITGRKGRFCHTYTGHKFYPFDPRPDEINLTDIAYGLSHVCRWGGHVRHHVSVAQHCVLVASILPKELALEGLFHDGSEAYIGDMIRPFKSHMPLFLEAERRIEQAIALKFGLQYPWPEAVMVADNSVLAAESRDILGARLEVPYEPPSGMIVDPWAPSYARERWLAMYEILKRGP